MSNAGYIRSGLLQRGLPGHVADAFIVNFRDESGLNPGINEAKPLVPGSRGGFGLYQLTGPRRREYEAFASRRGVQPSDVDAQLDFLMGELQGSERRAGQRILAAPDTATAAQAIVNDFLRPAASHRAKRSARYASLGGGASAYNAEPQPSVAASAIDSILGTNSAPQGPMAYGGDTVAQGGRMGGLGGLGGFTPPSQDVGLDTGAILRALGAGLIAGDASAVPAYLQQAIADQQRNVDRDYEREWQQYAFRTGLEENALERQDRAAERADNRAWRQDERTYDRNRDAITDGRWNAEFDLRRQEAERLAAGYRMVTDPQERARYGIPADDNRPYQLSPQGQLSVPGGMGQSATPGTEARQRRELAIETGIDPESSEGQRFILTGSLPAADRGVTAGDRQAIRDADDMVMSGEATIGLLNRALELSDEAFSGPLAGARATVGAVFGNEGAMATREYDNIVTEQALGQLKAIFGGAPTEGERAILLEIQGSSSQPRPVRDAILRRAIAAAERRINFNRDRASELRGGTYYNPRDGGNEGGGTPAPAAPPAAGARSLDDLLGMYGGGS